MLYYLDFCCKQVYCRREVSTIRICGLATLNFRRKTRRGEVVRYLNMSVWGDHLMEKFWILITIIQNNKIKKWCISKWPQIINKYRLLWKNFMCICVFVCMYNKYVLLPTKTRTGGWIPGAGVTSNCETHDTGAGKWTCVSWKSTMSY